MHHRHVNVSPSFGSHHGTASDVTSLTRYSEPNPAWLGVRWRVHDSWWQQTPALTGALRLLTVRHTFSRERGRERAVIGTGACLIAATYGLVRMTYGLFLPEIQHDLGLSASVAGYISSGSSLAYCAAAAAGFVWSRDMPRALIVAAAVSACGGVWGMASASGVAMFGVGAVISSAGAGFASPALITIIARNVARPRVDRAQSFVNGGSGPGLVAAGALALWLLPDWRPAWVAIGAVTAVVATAVLVLDRSDDAPAHTVRPTAVSKIWLGDHLAPLLAAVLMGAGSSAVWVYGRSLLIETGPDRDTVAAWIVLGLGATCAIATAGPLTRQAPQRAWLIACSATACSGLTLSVAAQHTVVALAACFIFGWAFTASTSVLISWTGHIDAGNAAAGTAILFVAVVFGQAAGATAVGLLVSATGFTTAFFIAGISTAAAAAVSMFSNAPTTRSRRP